MTTRGRSRGRNRRARGLKGKLLQISDNPRRRVIALVAVVLVLSGLLFAWEAFRAANALQKADDQAEILQQHIVTGDVDAARATLKKLDASSSRAHNSSNGPLWWLGAHVPILGRNVDAVSTVARDIDQIVDEVLPGVVDVADKVRLETFRPKGGRVNLQEVAQAAPVLVKANDVLSQGNRDVSDIDVNGLIPGLREPMRTLQNRFKRTAVAASAANDAAKLLPTMLAADGKKRRYLLLILNNAEVRSLGGMPGSTAVITTQNGKLKMGKQGGIHDIRPLKKPALALTKDERSVFPTSIATDMRDAAIDPDFPRAAQLAAAAVGKRLKVEFDGVVAVDPVAMGYMLRGLGPVDVGDNITINTTNAVSTLLNYVYVKYPTDTDKQDDVFEKAARRIFDATVDGTGDSVAVIRSLVRGVGEGRVMLWSRDTTEQKRIQSSGISGDLDTGNGRPQVGVYVNDAGATKMEFYLDMGTSVRSERCLAGGRQELRVTTTLTSRAPANAPLLSPSIVNRGFFVRPGNMLLGVMIFGPRGGKITSMTADGQAGPIGRSGLNGRPVVKVARELPPGQSSVIVTTMTTARQNPQDPELRTTPGVSANGDRSERSACR